jgi:hypothetical protein
VLYLYLVSCILAVSSSVLLWCHFSRDFSMALSVCFDLAVLTARAGHDAAAPPWATG